LLAAQAFGAEYAFSCPAGGQTRPATLRKVIDGDTLLLSDGRHVRLIGVNAPELRHGERREEAGAIEASRFARRFLGNHALLMVTEEEQHDRFGRVLAHVYRTDGANLAAALLEAGLARVIAVPPNIGHLRCLARIEASSRRRKTGLWAQSAFQSIPASALAPRMTGFRAVRGRISAVERARHGWWVEIDSHLALNITSIDQRYFQWRNIDALKGREVEARGWVIARAQREGNSKPRPPFLMRLRHPASLAVCTNDEVACEMLSF
jgi:micrococcal nuclease